MEKELKVGVHNYFEFVRSDAKTGKVLGTYRAENIILDNFWAKYLSSTSADSFKYIHFGSGTAAPIATDVKLTSWVGYKVAPAFDAGGTTYDYSQYYTDGIASLKKTVRLQDTEYNGNFISEVGYSSGTASTSGLLTKALVKDMNGNVVSIEKKSGEILDIFATVYFKCFGVFDSGRAGFGQDDHIGGATPVFGRILGMSNWTGAAIAPYYTQGRPRRCGDYSVNRSLPASFTPGNFTPTFDVAGKKVIFSIPNLTSSIGNIVGGIRGLAIDGILIDLPCTGVNQPVITKEVVGTGDGTTQNFQTKFGFLKDNGTAKAYVNDIEVPATFDFNRPYPKTNIINDMVVVDYQKFASDRTLASSCYFDFTGGRPEFWLILENPLYAVAPITTIKMGYMIVLASNDLSTWTEILNQSTNNTFAVPSSYQSYRYFKIVPINTNGKLAEFNSPVAANLKNIHLSAPPSVGSTVAVTYQPDVIAKDAQHVLNNVKVTLTFNEYTP